MVPHDLRREYGDRGLTEADLERDPLRQFERWLDEAVAAEVPDANAMTLATATGDGIPSARIVLLKGFDERGFTFYTNYESSKARELEGNPRVALVFYWQPLDRQVRVSGTVSRVSVAESAAYFATRPLGAQLGAWASRQSSVIGRREELQARMAELERQYASKDVPLPPFWGGYCVQPRAVEFWQGRPNRLHDRLRYVRETGGSWRIERLAP